MDSVIWYDKNNITVEQLSCRTMEGAHKMKVIALNGSPHPVGNTYQALEIVAAALKEEQIDTEIITIGDKLIRGCTGCHSCKKTGRCILDDPEFFEILAKIHAADGLLLASPVYYGGITGVMKSFLDRAFFSSTAGQLRFKIGASLVVLRRAGAMSALSELNTFLLASEFIVVPSGFNVVFGARPDEVQQDKEGLWRMRSLGKNMAWLIKMKDSTKDELTPPAETDRVFFNFIR